ncbi:hypothetical protein HYZ41_04290 [archaeon]|nr:hypothetical protein [archaeon]
MKRNKLETGFATIHRNKSLDRSIVRYFSNAFKINKRFFYKTPKRFNIIICDNEKEFEKESGKYYQKLFTAVVTDNRNIVIMSPEFIARKRQKNRDFQQICTHEMSHVFWYSFYKTWTPSWLMEGLPCHVSNGFLLNKRKLLDIIYEYNVRSDILDYKYIKKNFKKGHIPRYPVWANFTRFISKKYSDRKVIEFMDVYSKKKNKNHYRQTFKKAFGKSDTQLFQEFLVSLKK